MNVIPATKEEFEKTGWTCPDIVLISGDAYVDHPAFGTAVIARVLEKRGYRVAVIDQPDVNDPKSVAVFGRPRLFFGVSSGNVDSMLTRYTAFRKVRNDDPFSPDNIPVNRCDRALIRYCNLIKQNYKDSYIVIGGIEASMRRFFHYDYWSNSVRRSVLLDSRADILVYGMGERAVCEIAETLDSEKRPSGIYGTVSVESREFVSGEETVYLDDEKECQNDKKIFSDNFRKIYLNGDSVIAQPAGNRMLVQYPHLLLSQCEIDAVHDLPFTRKPHPKYEGKRIAAFEMINNSVNSHRGCASGCAFCSISLHQGRKIVSRSVNSILREIKMMASGGSFSGHITDIGGPSANMYGTVCTNLKRCLRISCLYPDRCRFLKTAQKEWISLLEKAKGIKGVKHVTVGSGLRYDLFMHDNPELLGRLVDHVSGQLKIAPEHTEENVLGVMRKKPLYSLAGFRKKFSEAVERKGKKYYIIPYFMSNHPGCEIKDMKTMKSKITEIFRFQPDQVQSFIPLPMTLSSVMYYTGEDPFTEKKVFVERDMNAKRKQHMIFRKDIKER